VSLVLSQGAGSQVLIQPKRFANFFHVNLIIIGQDDLHVVEGFVVDRNKRKIAFLYGKWTEFLCSVDIESLEEFLGAKVEKVDPSASNLPKHAPLGLGVIPHSKVLWQVDPRPENSNLYYNFSQFTMGLNEMTPKYLVNLKELSV